MGNRLSKIYTKTGDDGTTGLGDGTRVAKDSARVAAYGTVDELNSSIGIVLAQEIPAPIREALTQIQHDLFDLGGELCIPGMPPTPSSRSTRYCPIVCGADCGNVAAAAIAPSKVVSHPGSRASRRETSARTSGSGSLACRNASRSSAGCSSVA